MPKLKTHKATAKRFRLTGSGKLMRTKGEKRHLRRKRSKRAKRSAWRMREVETRGEIRRIKRLAPYLRKRGR
ncbi:MAG: 50S ribosomal protein L35 [Anaerolineales bacterium]|nr:MAG: 50S ribosomal protein L35 [Anaerolineales bacterium]